MTQVQQVGSRNAGNSSKGEGPGPERPEEDPVQRGLLGQALLHGAHHDEVESGPS